MEQNLSQKAVFAFFIVLFCIALLLAGKLMAPFFAIIILGVVSTGIFNPVFKFLSKKLTPRIASILTCILIFFVVFIPVVFLSGSFPKRRLIFMSWPRMQFFQTS